MAYHSTASFIPSERIVAPPESVAPGELDGFEGAISTHLPLSLTLAFPDPAYEARFLRYYAAFYYRYAQGAVALGVCLIFFDFFADVFLTPQVASNYDRLYVCIPILIIGIAVSFVQYVRERWQTVISAFIVVLSISLFMTLQKIDAEGGMGLRSWVGVLNYTMLELYGFVVLGIGLRYSFFSGLLIMVAFESAVYDFSSNELRSFFYLSYQIVSVFILTLVLGWWREYALRKDFAVQDNLLAAKRALAHHNATLEFEVERRTREMVSSQDAAILTLASLCDTRDNETGNHIRRTQQYVMELARKLQTHPRFSHYLTDAQMTMLFKSAPLHDLGKVGISDSILHKPGPLEPDEFEIMKTHTTLGFQAIEAAQRQLGEKVDFLACVQEIALNHHEKWDGSGYPRNLCGEQIPISARLMALADVYDALTSKRVYKAAFSHARSVAIIREGRGSHFDPDIVDAFVEIADKFEAIAKRYVD